MYGVPYILSYEWCSVDERLNLQGMKINVDLIWEKSDSKVY